MMDKRLLALVPEALRHVLATVAWPLLAAGIVLRVVAACAAMRPPSGRPSRTSCAMLVPGCCLATRS